MNLRDTLERLWWTFVAAFAGTLTTSPVLLALIEALSATPTSIDIAPLGYVLISAAVAGIIAVVNLLALIARSRLAVLPDPGAGLPGLPTTPERINVEIRGDLDPQATAQAINRALRQKGT